MKHIKVSSHTRKAHKVKAHTRKIKGAESKEGAGESYAKRKMGIVMHEFKKGKLHSGSKSGKKVKSRKQAIAIALSYGK